MNFWEFLSQPVFGTPKEDKLFWDGVNKRKAAKHKKADTHQHLHITKEEYDKEMKQLEEDIETIDI